MNGEPRTALALLVLRFSGLALALQHGWGKASSLAAGEGQGFIDGVARLGFPAPAVFAWAAALTELVGGTLILLGLATRVAAGLAAVTMIVAAFLRHRFLSQVLVFLGAIEVPAETREAWGDPERALLFLFCLLPLVFLGGGRYSLDRALAERSSRRGRLRR